MTVYLRPIGQPFTHNLEFKEIHLSQVCVGVWAWVWVWVWVWAGMGGGVGV